MRRIRLLTIAAAVLVAPWVVMAPASADHVVDVVGERCRWGMFVNPIGQDLWTTHLSVERDASGTVVSYTCHFKGLPAFVPAEERGPYGYREDWYAPKKALKTSGFDCWGLEGWNPNEVGFGSGVGLITPAGTAKVTCTWP